MVVKDYTQVPVDVVNQFNEPLQISNNRQM
jgi:hypothetical protein